MEDWSFVSVFSCPICLKHGLRFHPSNKEHVQNAVAGPESNSRENPTSKEEGEAGGEGEEGRETRLLHCHGDRDFQGKVLSL